MCMMSIDSLLYVFEPHKIYALRGVRHEAMLFPILGGLKIKYTFFTFKTIDSIAVFTI